MSARVVIVGGGFAGVSTARELERLAHRGEVQLTLVNRENYLLFTPMLPEVASGSIETRHIAQPLRALLAHEGQFELGSALSIDTARREVLIEHPIARDVKAIAYDELVLALGACASSMGVPGVDKFALPFKTLADAETVRSRVVGALEVAAKTSNLLERDRLLRFAIVGGNFTGVELAGEICAFLESIVEYYPHLDAGAIEIVVVEQGERLLAHLPAKFGKYAAAALRRRGVNLLLGQPVAAVDAHGVELKSGVKIASSTVIWAAGEEPSPLARQLGLETNAHGAIETLGDFTVRGTPHVWAAGDCAAVPRPEGGTYSPLAQNAMREGKLLARNLLAKLREKPTRNFRYRELGQMASLGDRNALAEVPGGRMIAGLPAWMLWRSYYLGRLPGWNKKTRVALDWMLGAVFPPRVARLPLVHRGEVPFLELHAARK